MNYTRKAIKQGWNKIPCRWNRIEYSIWLCSTWYYLRQLVDTIPRTIYAIDSLLARELKIALVKHSRQYARDIYIFIVCLPRFIFTCGQNAIDMVCLLHVIINRSGQLARNTYEVIKKKKNKKKKRRNILIRDGVMLQRS